MWVGGVGKLRRALGAVASPAPSAGWQAGRRPTTYEELAGCAGFWADAQICEPRARCGDRKGDDRDLCVEHDAERTYLQATPKRGINDALYADEGSESPFRAGADSTFVETLPPMEQVEGSYVCPDEACPRSEGIDALGRPPRCALSGKLMRFALLGHGHALDVPRLGAWIDDQSASMAGRPGAVVAMVAVALLAAVGAAWVASLAARLVERLWLARRHDSRPATAFAAAIERLDKRITTYYGGLALRSAWPRV